MRLSDVKLGLGLRGRVKEIEYMRRNLFKPDLNNLQTPERIGVIYHEPSDMCTTDRLMLYALVRGLRPSFALEIGVRWGGSARIITNAMEENGVGKLVGIDPEPATFRAKPRDLHGRYTLITGYSPQAIPMAVKALGGANKLDFVFIDALHTYEAAIADFRGCIPYLAEGAHVLLHDAYHQGIAQAVQDVITENPCFFDCGLLTRNAEPSSPVAYQGLRLIRKGPVVVEQLIRDVYARNHLSTPPFTNEVWNWDAWLNSLSPEELAEEKRKAREWKPS